MFDCYRITVIKRQRTIAVTEWAHCQRQVAFLAINFKNKDWNMQTIITYYIQTSILKPAARMVYVVEWSLC